MVASLVRTNPLPTRRFPTLLPFRPTAGRRHLHRHYNFAELLVETAVNSLHDSCRSELTRQGIDSVFKTRGQLLVVARLLIFSHSGLESELLQFYRHRPGARFHGLADRRIEDCFG